MDDVLIRIIYVATVVAVATIDELAAVDLYHEHKPQHCTSRCHPCPQQSACYRPSYDLWSFCRKIQGIINEIFCASI